MAYEWLVTADWHDTDVFTYFTGIERSSTTARTGTYSFKCIYDRSFFLAVSSASTKYAGVGFYLNSHDPYAAHIEFREGDTAHIRIALDTDSGTIKVYRSPGGGQVLLGSGGTVSNLGWWYIGAACTVHDSTGSVVVELDGEEVINISGADTRNGETGIIDNIRFFTDYGYIDDIKVRTDAIPGVGGLYVKVPTGNGTDTGWTASAGSAYECVDDAPATFPDYIYTDVSVTSTKSTFTHGGLTEPAYDSIDCVCVAAKAQLDASGLGNIRSIIESNGSYGSGSAVALSTSEKYVHLFQETDPDTAAAWTKAGVNAAEPGVETI